MSTYDSIIGGVAFIAFPIAAYAILCLISPKMMPFGGKLEYTNDIVSFITAKRKIYGRKRLYASLLLLYAFLHVIVFSMCFSTEYKEKNRRERAEKDSIESVRHNAEEMLYHIHASVEQYIKERADDEDSYEPVSWSDVYNDDAGFTYIDHTFRVRNRFGAKVRNVMKFLLDDKGNVIAGEVIH